MAFAFIRQILLKRVKLVFLLFDIIFLLVYPYLKLHINNKKKQTQRLKNPEEKALWHDYEHLFRTLSNIYDEAFSENSELFSNGAEWYYILWCKSQSGLVG